MDCARRTSKDVLASDGGMGFVMDALLGSEVTTLDPLLEEVMASKDDALADLHRVYNNK